jgi:hypothetical protein
MTNAMHRVGASALPLAFVGFGWLFLAFRRRQSQGKPRCRARKPSLDLGFCWLSLAFDRRSTRPRQGASAGSAVFFCKLSAFVSIRRATQPNPAGKARRMSKDVNRRARHRQIRAQPPAQTAVHPTFPIHVSKQPHAASRARPVPPVPRRAPAEEKQPRRAEDCGNIMFFFCSKSQRRSPGPGGVGEARWTALETMA